MIPAQELRARARRSLNDNIFGRTWLMLILCAVVGGAIVAVPSIISSVSSAMPTWLAALIAMPLFVLSVFLGGPVDYAMARIYLKVARGNRNVDVKDVFVGFKENLAESVILGFMRDLYIFLWSLLFIIPGIVKSYAYSMAFYIMQDGEGKKTWKACLDESQQLMDGYKGKLFLLDLTFIGWYILGALCFGVGALWVSAYHQEARAHFYEELLRDKYGLTDEDFEDDSDADDPYFLAEDGEEEEEIYDEEDEDGEEDDSKEFPSDDEEDDSKEFPSDDE